MDRVDARHLNGVADHRRDRDSKCDYRGKDKWRRAKRDPLIERVDVEKPVIVLSFDKEPHGRFRIEVRDNGPGIPEARREDVFLPFYTTHEGGSGVGLSFARQVALAHGGSVCALAASEGGANIRLII